MGTSPTRHRWICAALIALHAALLAWSAVTNSVTFDEYAHLPAGVAYWTHGDFSIFDLSPPLVRLVAAAPAVMAGAAAPPTGDVDGRLPKDRHWVYGREFLRANAARYQWLFELGRFALIPVSCAGAYLVYRWARGLYGASAGVAGCAMYCLSPNVLAHGSLVTTDVATMVVMSGAAYAWWQFCRKPDWSRGALAAGVVAVAQLCKFTALLLWPVMVAIAAWELYSLGVGRWRRVLCGYGVAVVVALVAVNGCYLFRGTGTRLGAYEFRSATMIGLKGVAGWVPAPLPYSYVEGFDAQKWEAEGTHQGFLLGEVYDGARWYFYPVAVGLKTPVGMLALAMVAVGCRRKWAGGEVVCLIAGGMLVTGMVGLARMNIGVRYLLPAYPMAYVLMARVWAGGRRLAWVGSGLLLVAVVESVGVGPDFISFANVFAGGPREGWRVVNDSNYDWGQDLIRLKRWMEVNGVESVHLGYFGRVDPAVYGIRSTPLNRPSGDRYVVVSTYYLDGLAHRLPTGEGAGAFVRIPFSAELARRKPATVVGRTLYVYERETVAAAMAEHGRAGR